MADGTDETPFLQSMVLDYLKSVSSGLANKFKKSVGEVEELPDGSPKLLDVLNNYKKRKATDEGYGSLTGTPSKKAKLNGVHAKVCMNGKKDESSSSEGDSSEDEEDEKMKPADTNGKTNGKKAESSSEDEESDEGTS